MTKANKRSKQKGGAWAKVAISGLLLAVLAVWLLLRSMPLQGQDTHVYFDKDDTQDSVCEKLSVRTGTIEVGLFKVLSVVTGVNNSVRVGYYNLEKTSLLSFFRRYRNRQQSEVKLKINNTVRTLPDLAEVLGGQLMLSREEIEEALTNREFCAKYGFTPESIIAVFLPNTYNVYWDTSIAKLVERMKKEYDVFWTKARIAKAKSIGLSPLEVITIASIVEEETSYAPEKAAVAGMYINRLAKKMRLQADPTVKYAVGDFSLRRILTEHLQIDHPYNTYRHEGLPPGPIRVPSVATIDAVLQRKKHNYLYMCAKEDFSGAHNFAETYEEHLKNADRYRKALDERGIR